MELFDTHFHYYGETSPAEFMRNMTAEMNLPPQSPVGIPDRLLMMAAGADYLESCRAMEFAQSVDTAWFSAGVHPHSAEPYRQERNDFSTFRGHPRLKAVGEIGLDFFYEHSARAEQIGVFEEFLELALSWNLPAIVHIRDKEGRSDAYETGYRLLGDFAAAGGRFVVHCFAGTPEWAEKMLALGAFLGITGIVTFPRAQNIRDTLQVIPDDRLVIETDSPYLAPLPQRGAKNHPGYLIHIADHVARNRGATLAEIAALTTVNGKRLFGIDPEEAR